MTTHSNHEDTASDNPNRPTGLDYCAQGAHTRENHYEDGTCYGSPRPRTAWEQGTLDRAATIDALTDDQRRTALLYLSSADTYDGPADRRWKNAIAYVLNPR